MNTMCVLIQYEQFIRCLLYNTYWSNDETLYLSILYLSILYLSILYLMHTLNPQ